MEYENQKYVVGTRDVYKTTDRNETELNLQGETEFSPAYEELKLDFSSNPFNASSCRCKPGRC